MIQILADTDWSETTISYGLAYIKSRINKPFFHIILLPLEWKVISVEPLKIYDTWQA